MGTFGITRKVGPFLFLAPDSRYPYRFWTWLVLTFDYESGRGHRRPCFDPMCDQGEDDPDAPGGYSAWGECKHKRLALPPLHGGHVPYQCAPDCDNEFCNYCQGGLFTCVVCTASEGELTPKCPGRRLTSEEKEGYYRWGAMPPGCVW